MGRKTIIVHVGCPKTGTTTIQEILTTNAQELESLNISYPLLKDATGYGINRVANGAILLPEYFDSNALEKKFMQLLENNDQIFFSEEVLFLGDNSRFLKYLANDNTTIVVVCYLRNAADYLASIWAELNRPENSATPPPLEYFIHTDFYERSLNSLIGLASECKNFIFKISPYLEGNGFNIAERFFRDVGLPEKFWIENPVRKNSSLTRKEADINQAIVDEGLSTPSGFDSEWLIDLANTIESGDPRKVIETMADEEIDWVCKKHEPLLNYLVRKIGRHDFSFSDVRPSCFGRNRDQYKRIRSSDMPKIFSRIQGL